MSIRSELIQAWLGAAREAGVIGPNDSAEDEKALLGAVIQAAATEYSTALILAAAKPKMGGAEVLERLPDNWKRKR